MEADNKGQIKAAVDEVSRAVSDGHSFVVAARGMRVLAEYLAERFASVDTEEKVAAMLADVSVPSEKQLQLLSSFAYVLPSALTEMIREMLQAGLERLPPAKTGPKTIGTLEKLAICDQVLALIGSGCRESAALLRASQRVDRSERSVRRIWSERNRLKGSFTVDDVKATLATLLFTGQLDPNIVARFTAVGDDPSSADVSVDVPAGGQQRLELD